MKHQSLFRFSLASIVALLLAAVSHAQMPPLLPPTVRAAIQSTQQPPPGNPPPGKQSPPGGQPDGAGPPPPANPPRTPPPGVRPRSADPTQPGPPLRSLLGEESATRSTISEGLPEVRLRARIVGPQRVPSAVVEVGGKFQIVSEGDQFTVADETGIVEVRVVKLSAKAFQIEYINRKQVISLN